MAKARLGQNFLVDAAAQLRIAEALGPVREQPVVEIGPGKAAITELLAKRTQRLVVIEVDPLLAVGLRARFADGLEVIESDVLRVDLSALAARLGAPRLAVVGNLPYYITSDILLHLFAHAAVVSHAVVMVQREVADRIVAEPGSSDYGLLSATCQLYARCERLFTLPPSAFAPAPEVYSSVVRMRFAPLFDRLGVDASAFVAYLKASFAQKRKTLVNNLRAGGFSTERIRAALEEAGVSPTARAETLELQQQARVFLALTR